MNIDGIPQDIVDKNIKVFLSNFSFYGECTKIDTENGVIHLKELDENTLLINVESADAITIIEEPDDN